jgi:hypothetical protein
MVFLGPMRKIFYCPKLSYLHYGISNSEFAGDTVERDTRNPFLSPVRYLLDEIFFQETPALRSISLKGTEMDDVFAPILASCPTLRTLKIKNCRIATFLDQFLEHLQDTRRFPSLRTFCMYNSWPFELELSYEELAAHCSAKRPGIRMLGNEREPSEPFYAGDLSQSDYDSEEDDTDSDETSDS